MKYADASEKWFISKNNYFLQHCQIAGNPLELLVPPIRGNSGWGTRVMTGHNGKNLKDWEIRSQVLRLVFGKSYGCSSTTKWQWVLGDLTNPPKWA